VATEHATYTKCASLASSVLNHLWIMPRDFERKVYNFLFFFARGIEDRHAGTPLATIGTKNIFKVLEEAYTSIYTNKSFSKAESHSKTSKAVHLRLFINPPMTRQPSFDNEMTLLDQRRVESSPGFNSFRDFCGCRAPCLQHPVPRVHL
jgi:hypothetical protein